MTDLHEKLVIATKRAEHLEARNQRLADLVRYKHHELHLDGLISDEEYGEIVKDHGAVARLEGYDAVKAKCDRLEAEKVEYEQSFDLRHKADMRVIESWREGDPAKELIMPDHADLCVWLLGEWEKLNAKCLELENSLRNQRGDDLCWIQNVEVAKALPEAEFLESWRRYHAQIVAERGVFTGGKTIAQLEADAAKLREATEWALEMIEQEGIQLAVLMMLINWHRYFNGQSWSAATRKSVQS